MKSVTVAAAAAVLAGISNAQPHGHHAHQHLHAKRDLVTEWETVWETVTVLVDESTTETLLPTSTGSGAPGEFFQPLSSTATSTPEPQPTVAETSSSSSSTQAPPPPPTTTLQTSTSTSTSSSTPPPPAPTTTTTSTPEPAPAPETTSVYTPPPAPVETTSTSTPAPVETASSASSGSSSSSSDGFGTSSLDTKSYSGDITYYTLGLGACGYYDTGDDLTKPIVAISQADWYARGSGTNTGIGLPDHPWCDKTITIKGSNGKTTTALVHDICPGCASGSIDVSQDVFLALFGSLDAGRLTQTWSFDD
ncbi:hypothetical protein F4678DRAFT_460631 [Xylaria arbuscula]|nr:hypothetical protein F4678DRAFT_460631 [Xylaria arbuscula]